MALYRVTWMFDGKKHGWGETLVFNRTSTVPGGLAADLLPLTDLRAQLMGKGFTIIGFRVSRIRDDAGLPVRRNVFLVEQNFISRNGTAANAGDQDNACIVVRASNADGTREKNMFFGAVPDSIIVDNGTLTKDAVNWGTNFAAWNAEAVRLGAGWLGFEANQEANITGYVLNSAMIATFTVAGTPFTGVNANIRQTVRIRGLNGGNSVFNKSLIVFPAGPSNAQNVKPIAAQEFVSSGVMTLFKQPSTFFLAAGFGPVKPGTHKRGRFLLSSPGRARRRATV